MCELLGVDAVITSNFGLSKPISDGGAIAIALITGYGVATNQVEVDMEIKDCNSKSLLWKYYHTYSGGIGSDYNQLVNGLMRNASRKMPYFVRNTSPIN